MSPSHCTNFDDPAYMWDPENTHIWYLGLPITLSTQAAWEWQSPVPVHAMTLGEGIRTEGPLACGRCLMVGFGPSAKGTFSCFPHAMWHTTTSLTWSPSSHMPQPVLGTLDNPSHSSCYSGSSMGPSSRGGGLDLPQEVPWGSGPSVQVCLPDTGNWEEQTVLRCPSCLQSALGRGPHISRASIFQL